MALPFAARGRLATSAFASVHRLCGASRTQALSTSVLRSLAAVSHIKALDGPTTFKPQLSKYENLLLPPIARGLHTSTSSFSDKAAESPESDGIVAEEVYEGALAKTVTNVKMLSVASCFITTLGSPIIIGLSRPDLSFSMQCSSAGMLAGFGFVTTFMLQWFVSPYILRMSVRSKDTIEILRLNFLARQTLDVVDIKDIVPPQTVKPLSTFSAGGRIYFFDRDAWDAEKHQDVLKSLLTQAGEAPEEETPEEAEEEEATEDTKADTQKKE
eukprot:9112678-Pyramimonas_sp.AAC.2